MGKIFDEFDRRVSNYGAIDVGIGYDINGKTVNVGERVMFTKSSPGGISYGTITKIKQRVLSNFSIYQYFFIKFDKGRETVKITGEIIKL